MTHVGDITALSGYALPPVDVVTGGSPCQDLSIAGKQAGLSGERSGLFFEQIRIIKELREADRKRGRTGVLIRPRFTLWENVLGAFSSNKGRDFQRVLTECVRIAEPSAPDVPIPEKGWTKAGALVGDGWSLAWRTLDAQYWGVPQRRRRIALVCDFGGGAAGEILFDEQGVSGHSAPRRETGKGTAGAFESCAYPAIARTLTAEHDASFCIDRGPNVIVQNVVKCLNPWDSQSGRIYDADGAFHSLVSCESAGMQRDAVFTIPIHDKATRYKGGGATRNGDGSGNGLGAGKDGDPCPTLTAADKHAVFAVHQNQAGEVRVAETAYTLNTNANATGRNSPLCYDARGNGDGETVCTLTGDHANRVTDYTPIVARCLTANCYKQKGRADAETYLSKGGIVRRLTPLEAERLQGYPDGYTDIGDWTDDNGKTHKTSDSARYRALGNSIALPPWKWVLSRIAAQYDRMPTLGSLFDGIGGFSFLWEEINGKGAALWASEIEPFCIAVTKRRLGEAEQ